MLESCQPGKEIAAQLPPHQAQDARVEVLLLALAAALVAPMAKKPSDGAEDRSQGLQQPSSWPCSPHGRMPLGML
jgi:hypothetical protein